MQRKNLNIMCSIKVKGLVDSLGSIGPLIDDEDLVSVTLNGLGKEYAQFRSSIGILDIFFNFQELVALLFNQEQRDGGSAT